MQQPVTVTAHHLELPPVVANLIQEQTTKLERFYPRLTTCRVVVEGPGPRRQPGGTYTVHIDLHVPGSRLVVDRHSDGNLMAATRQAFRAARRQLQVFAERRRGAVKTHHTPVPEVTPPEE